MRAGRGPGSGGGTQWRGKVVFGRNGVGKREGPSGTPIEIAKAVKECAIGVKVCGWVSRGANGRVNDWRI